MFINSPDHFRVIRIAAWVWILYLFCLAIVDQLIYVDGAPQPVFEYQILNGIPALIFLALAYIRWNDKYSKLIIPIIILIIALSPILVNHLLNLRLPQAPLSNLEGMVFRQLPILFIALILVAWHYRLSLMIVFSLGINLFELLIVFALGNMNAQKLMVFIFIVTVRTICFLVVGLFINQLIVYLRAQQQSLITANDQLTHYASTLENLTISRERNRMSRELHDTVIHTLSGLSVQLETARAYWDVNPETARNLTEQSLQATRSGLIETRRALKELRASPLEDLGLVKALQHICRSAADRGKLKLNISSPERDFFLSPDVEQCIYRVAQEALENVVHHANAKQLNVTLCIIGKDITLIIQDDGIGFNPSEDLPGGHFGIAGMKERAQLTGGDFQVNSRPQNGTTIQLTIKGCIG